jgi:hypothetical protein
MASRKRSGISVHPHQSTPRMSWRMVRARSVSGPLRKCRMKNATATIENAARIRPGMTESKNKRMVAQNGTLGWGVDSSRLPQWEHALALRGFTWSFGQSLMS